MARRGCCIAPIVSALPQRPFKIGTAFITDVMYRGLMICHQGRTPIMRFAAKLVALLAPLLLLSIVTPARGEAEAGVMDNAKFFSPDAVRKASDDLKEIRKQHGKDLVIETFASIPDDRKSAYDAAK